MGHLWTEGESANYGRRLKKIINGSCSLNDIFRNVGRDENTIDLHGLHVSEAIEALRNFLSEKSGMF